MSIEDMTRRLRLKGYRVSKAKTGRTVLEPIAACGKSVSRGLVVAFPDGSPSFVHGFEAGQIWQMMKAGVSEIERTIHSANEEVIRRMSVAEGYEAKFAPVADESGAEYPTYRWVHIRKVQAAPERPNPHGLRVVKNSSSV